MTAIEIHQRFLRYERRVKKGCKILDTASYGGFVSIPFSLVSMYIEGFDPFQWTGMTLLLLTIPVGLTGAFFTRSGLRGMDQCTQELAAINRKIIESLKNET